MIRNEEFNKALELLNEIEENTDTCCAITMDPEDVSVLINKLRTIIEKLKDE
jgi:hypothetical protein|tara:strand:- start:815 stop:970 length:156 start_codon:yes stop_codon:yes gene_type:complete